MDLLRRMVKSACCRKDRILKLTSLNASFLSLLPIANICPSGLNLRVVIPVVKFSKVFRSFGVGVCEDIDVVDGRSSSSGDVIREEESASGP